MCLHGCQSKSGIIQCAKGSTGTYVYRVMWHLFIVDLTLDRVKVKCWQLYPWMMINMSRIDLCLYLCMFKCLCLSAQVHACIYTCVCVCERVCVHVHAHAHFWAGSPCSLLLSPLCEACPPLEGPGVPAECVEVASSWSLQEAGFWGLKREKASVGSIHPSVHPSTFPVQTANQEQREQEEGEREEGEVERERHRKWERPYEYAGKVRVTSVRVHRHCEGPWPAYILLARRRALLPISQLAENQRCH